MKVNSEVRYASHPADAKHYDTKQLRENYLIENVFTADQINIVYTMQDDCRRCNACGRSPGTQAY